MTFIVKKVASLLHIADFLYCIIFFERLSNYLLLQTFVQGWGLGEV